MYLTESETDVRFIKYLNQNQKKNIGHINKAVEGRKCYLCEVVVVEWLKMLSLKPRVFDLNPAGYVYESDINEVCKNILTIC